MNAVLVSQNFVNRLRVLRAEMKKLTRLEIISGTITA